MLPAVSAPTYPIPGPPFQNSVLNESVRTRLPLASVHPSFAIAAPASSSNPLVDLLKDEPMGSESDGDDTSLPPASDVELFPSLEGDRKDHTLVDGTDYGLDFHYYNTAKADELVSCPLLRPSQPHVSI